MKSLWNSYSSSFCYKEKVKVKENGSTPMIYTFWYFYVLEFISSNCLVKLNLGLLQRYLGNSLTDIDFFFLDMYIYILFMAYIYHY